MHLKYPSHAHISHAHSLPKQMDNDSDAEYDDIELDDSGRPMVSRNGPTPIIPSPTRSGVAVLPPIPVQHRGTFPRTNLSKIVLPVQEGEQLLFFNKHFSSIMNYDVIKNKSRHWPWLWVWLAIIVFLSELQIWEGNFLNPNYYLSYSKLDPFPPTKLPTQK